jgi:exodeoxyribonuclease V alpha subunit
VFRNPDNGYTVLRLDAGRSDGDVTVVGNIPSVSPGMHLVVRGQESAHSKYGSQFTAASVTESKPSGTTEIARYLSSGLIKGIGEKTAEKLVEAFGEKTIEMIQNEPDKVAKISGVGTHRAQLMQAAFAAHEEEQESVRFLIEKGISNSLSQKIYKLYGPRTIETVSKNPYRLAKDVWGVGFSTADSIAANLGIASDSHLRLKAGLIFTLERAAEGEGHCYLPAELLSERARALLGLEDNVDLQPPLDELISEGEILKSDAGYSFVTFHQAEESVADFISKRCSELTNPKISADLVEAALQKITEKTSFDLSVEQTEAVKRSALYPLLVITGGPGCGKTTIIQGIVAAFQEASLIVRLAAPTGRASQRMAQVCGIPASTVHRMLKFDPIKRRFIHGSDMPLVADVVIVDEVSMLDLFLAQSLFSAIGPNTTLILVGDKDQLPSVGPGRILGDLLSLVEVPAVSLSRVFRRSNESSINDIAHSINSGQIPEIPVPDGETKTDAYFIPRSEPEEISQLVQKLVADQIPRKFGIPTEEIVVLTPSNRGPLGTQNLNQTLQGFLNPSGKIDAEQELTVGENTLRIGDRVCQRVNNYQIDEHGVFNGDTGYIHSIEKFSGRVTVELWDGRLVDYERADLSQLSLAYAVTVHRSQGSEVPCVVVVLHDSHYTLLDRQLVYTAVTRAKKLLIIVGSKRALAIACKKTNTQRRLTQLPDRIRQKISIK